MGKQKAKYQVAIKLNAVLFYFVVSSTVSHLNSEQEQHTFCIHRAKMWLFSKQKESKKFAKTRSFCTLLFLLSLKSDKRLTFQFCNSITRGCTTLVRSKERCHTISQKQKTQGFRLPIYL